MRQTLRRGWIKAAGLIHLARSARATDGYASQPRQSPDPSLAWFAVGRLWAIVICCALVLVMMSAMHTAADKREAVSTSIRSPLDDAKLTLYGIVERPDGRIYELFANNQLLNGWTDRKGAPVGSVVAIRMFLAERQNDGMLRRDPDNRLVRSALDPELHVAEKRFEVADNRSMSRHQVGGTPSADGRWHFAAFDLESRGQLLAAPLEACRSCHMAPLARDGLFTTRLLSQFRNSGRVAVSKIRCPGRKPCNDVE
jgi:hypothetical protein